MPSLPQVPVLADGYDPSMDMDKDGLWINPRTDPGVIAAMHAVFENNNATLREKHRGQPYVLAAHNNFPTISSSDMLLLAQQERVAEVLKSKEQPR